MNVVTQVKSEVGFSNACFLVVESKPLFRDLAFAALSYLHTREIKHAADIHEAITTLKRFGGRINGLIFDWNMTPVGGLELLRMIRSQTLSKVSPEICAVILTGEADTAAMRAAMMLDVNGVAIAPLSQDGLVRTLCNARNRAWTLKAPEHYLAVPVLESPGADEAPAFSAAGKEIWRRDADTTADFGPNSVGSPASMPFSLSAFSPVKAFNIGKRLAGALLARH